MQSGKHENEIKIKSAEVEEDVDTQDDFDKSNEDTVYILSEEQKQMLGLDNDTIEAIQDVFKSLDEDSSGFLDVSEMETAMKSMGVECSEKEIETLVKQIDIDGDGTVNVFEFARMVSEKLKDYDPERELREAFAVFDQNGDGRVGMDEIRSVVESLGGKMTEEELDGMLQEADENNDGYIDYDEFAKIWFESGEKA